MKVQAQYTPAFKALIIKDEENFSTNQKKVVEKIKQNPEIISKYESINYDIAAYPINKDLVVISVIHKKPSKRDDIHTFYPYGRDDDPMYDLQDKFYRLKDCLFEKRLRFLLKLLLVAVAMRTIVSISSLCKKFGNDTAVKIEASQTIDTLKNLAKDSLQLYK